MRFTAKAQIRGTVAQAQGRFDDLRDATNPSLEYGLILCGLRPDPDGEHGAYVLDVESDADSVEDVHADFNRFRECETPGETFGVSLCSLTPVQGAPAPR